MSQFTDEAIQDGICRELEMLMSLKPNSLSADSDLTRLGVDSLRFVSLILAIEQKFGVNLLTVGIKSEDTHTARKMAAVVRSGMAG